MPSSYTSTATEHRAAAGIATSNGEAYSVKSLCASIEVGVSAANDTIKVGVVPSNARFLMSSTIHWDDLEAGASAPTLDLGLAAVDANITDDPDALSNGHALASAGSGNALSDIAFAGIEAWDLVSGQTSNPGGVFVVYASIVDDTTDQAGTVLFDLQYYVDS